MTNRNDLVGRYPWIDGVKTGHTLDAGYVLVASGQRDGMALISAVLGTDSATSRDANTLALLDYGAGFRVDAGRRARSWPAPRSRNRPPFSRRCQRRGTFTPVPLGARARP